MQQTPQLVMKRSQSECISFPSPVFSPSPMKRGSKIGFNVARELFDFPQSEEMLIKPRANTTTNIMTSSVRSFSDTSSNEWGSDSQGSFISNCESPSLSKNPFFQEHIFEEEVSFELPSRTSNPLVRDVHFKRNNQKLFEAITEANSTY
jgi:hypothetical protein